MAKRALLCGCNYPGSSHALNGCVNDVHAMHTMLTTHFGFSPENITKLIDTDPSSEQPTGANIKVTYRSITHARTRMQAEQQQGASPVTAAAGSYTAALCCSNRHACTQSQRTNALQ
jgi:hypothetical protein